MKLAKVVQIAPPFVFGAIAVVPAYPYADAVVAVKGSAVAVVARIPSNEVCHTAGKSAPAVCTSPRL